VFEAGRKAREPSDSLWWDGWNPAECGITGVASCMSNSGATHWRPESIPRTRFARSTQLAYA